MVLDREFVAAIGDVLDYLYDVNNEAKDFIKYVFEDGEPSHHIYLRALTVDMYLKGYVEISAEIAKIIEQAGIFKIRVKGETEWILLENHKNPNQLVDWWSDKEYSMTKKYCIRLTDNNGYGK